MSCLTKWPTGAVSYESAYSSPAYVWSSRTPRPINNETQRHPGMSLCAAKQCERVLAEVARLRKDLPKSDATDFRKTLESQ